MLSSLSSLLTKSCNSFKDRQQFGRTLMNKFPFSEHNIFVNQGSWGAPPKSVLKYQQKLRQEMERAPNLWFQYSVWDHLQRARECVADIVQANSEDIVFVKNATDAINTVLDSMQFKAGQKIIHFNCAYGQVLAKLQFMKENRQVVPVMISLDEVTLNSDEHILKLLHQALLDNPNTRLCIFDHQASCPSFIFPLKQAINLVKQVSPETLVLCDGAHAIGQLQINLRDLNADFYLSNLHKWHQCPKSTAFLYVKNQHQKSMNTVNVSFFYKNDFQKAFSWQGTEDLTAPLSLIKSLKFRKSLGGSEAIQTYCHNLACEVNSVIPLIWGTRSLIQDTARIGFLVNILLPVQCPFMIHRIQSVLMKKYDSFLAIFLFQQKYYVRFSCGVYNEIADYIKLAKEFIDLSVEYNSHPGRFIGCKPLFHGYLINAQNVFNLSNDEFRTHRNEILLDIIFKKIFTDFIAREGIHDEQLIGDLKYLLDTLIRMVIFGDEKSESRYEKWDQLQSIISENLTECKSNDTDEKHYNIHVKFSLLIENIVGVVLNRERERNK